MIRTYFILKKCKSETPYWSLHWLASKEGSSSTCFFLSFNLYSSVDLLRGQAARESMTIHESMMVVMVIRDEDDDHPS